MAVPQSSYFFGFAAVTIRGAMVFASSWSSGFLFDTAFLGS